MNQILGAVCVALCISTFLVWTHIEFGAWRFRKGHKEGYESGYLEGRKAADNWWLEVEAGADRARQQIWREEEKRG